MRSYGFVEGFVDQNIGRGFNLGVLRTLGGHMHGFLRWQQAARVSSMSTSLFYEGPEAFAGCTLQFGIPDTHLALSMTRKVTANTQIKAEARLSIMDLSLTYGFERRLSLNNSFRFDVKFVPPGPLWWHNAGERRESYLFCFFFGRLSKVDGVVVKFKYTRMQQAYTLPIMVHDQVVPDVVLYATVVPVRTWRSGAGKKQQSPALTLFCRVGTAVGGHVPGAALCRAAPAGQAVRAEGGRRQEGRAVARRGAQARGAAARAPHARNGPPQNPGCGLLLGRCAFCPNADASRRREGACWVNHPEAHLRRLA